MEALNAKWRQTFDVKVVAETGSTNADLLAAAGSGAPHGSVLVADFQSAGRGRLDRTWEAPAGANLLMSVLFRRQLEPLHRLTQRISLAAVAACERVGGVSPVLKWPNDLLIDDRKLSGVLAQVGGTGGNVEFVVVGIGLNVGWAPEGAARLLAGSRDQVLDALLEALADLPDDVTELYRRRLSTLGQQVRAELPTETIFGEAIDVAADGSLVIETPEGVRHVSVGDVTHLRRI